MGGLLDTLGLTARDAGLGSIVVLVVLLILTDKLVWHKRLRVLEKRVERWEGIALTALGVADKLTVQAEVTNEVLTRLPDPAAKGNDSP